MKPPQSDLAKESTTTRKPLRLWVLMLLMGSVLMGCTHHPGTGGNAGQVTGVYNLVTIDGKQLPCTPAHQGGAPLVKSGTFTINSDGTCNSKINFALPSGADSSREVSANYTLAGSTLRMQWHGAGQTTGTVDGNTFTMNNEGMLFTYRK